MGFLDYFIENYIMIFELVGLLVIMKVSAHLSGRMKRLTVLIVILLLAESVIFSLEQWTQSFETLSFMRPVLTAGLYSIYPVILMALTSLTVGKPTGKDMLLGIPWAVCVPVFFTSQWTHLCAWFTEDNHYHGGLLSYLPYFLFGFYIVVFMVRNVIYFRSYARMNRFVARYIALGSVAGLLLYLFFGGDRDYSTIFSSAILLYYVLVYIHMAKMDPLTSLPNRQSYYQDLKNENQNIFAVISIDMNDLKYLNDNLGHEAGDAALVALAGIIRKHCPRGCTPYRVGGDEFLITCRGISEFDIMAAISAMKGDLAKTSYSCAFGYALCDGADSIEKALKAADDRMYSDKAAFKRERGDRN